MEERDIEVSVVMPCLNEEAAIGRCIKKIKQVFQRKTSKERSLSQITALRTFSSDYWFKRGWQVVLSALELRGRSVQ